MTRFLPALLLALILSTGLAFGQGTGPITAPFQPPPVIVVAASGASQTIAFPASGNAVYDITQTANCTITLTGGTAGQYQTVTLILRQNVTAGWTATLPAGVKWSGGTAPTVNTLAGKIDVFTLSTPDAGATVFGSY